MVSIITGIKMTLNEYQEIARQTAVYPDEHRITYPSLGLASEAGEVAGKVKKVLRDHDGNFDSNQKDAIKDELGDVLWYVAVLAAEIGFSLDDVASRNAAKLEARMAKGKIQGEGDYR